jgi:hypothetical protein
LRHVQLQPVVWSPVTTVAWPLQFATVQTSPQTGKFAKPALQALQSFAASNLLAQELQVAPAHWLLHTHVQPVPLSPVTDVAWLLQSASVHSVVGAGVGAVQAGKSLRPAAHAPQSCAVSKRASHVPHCAPLHLFRHVQLQPDVWSPTTLAACPLQLATDEHTSPQTG